MLRSSRITHLWLQSEDPAPRPIFKHKTNMRRFYVRRMPQPLSFPLRSPALCFMMLRNGALTLADVRVSVLTVVCEPCGRRERYDVESLTRQYGWDASRDGS